MDRIGGFHSFDARANLWKKTKRWYDEADSRVRERPGHYIERIRVAPIVEKWLKEHRARFDSTGNHGPAWGHKSLDAPKPQSIGAMEALSAMTGISSRQLAFIRGVGNLTVRKDRGIIEGPPKYLTLDMVDRLLVGMDMVHLFHLPPPQGFSDVYLHPDVVDAPEPLELMAA